MNVLSLKRIWDKQPLSLILFVAIFFRLLAVIFSKGYGMFDDHFLVIEAAQSWVDGYDYNNWLPKSGNTEPQGHSYFYVGFHYLLLLFLEKTGLTDPQGKMYIVRFLHAIFSLLVITLGFKITWRLSNKKTAGFVAILLALYWFMPFFSVRNLVEFVCIPFLMGGVWLALKHNEDRQAIWYYLLAGLIMGLGFSVRYQSIMFTGVFGLTLFFFKKWKEPLMLALGAIIAILLTQGLIDFFIWGYPFAELVAYVQHNISHATEYIVSPWYTYILLLLGILIPPISIFLLYGFLWTAREKKYLLIFLPTLVFFIFHSVFPNKQERFIFPVIPFIIILGVIGWNEFVSRSKFWGQKKKLHKYCWIFFWAINLAILPVISTTYSKRAKVEAMTYLSQYDNIKLILIDNSNHYDVPLVPRYYADEWVRYIEVSKSNPPENLLGVQTANPEQIPRFYIFYEEENIEERVSKIKEKYPSIVFETKVDPGFIDKLLHWLNPINANETIHIYRNPDFVPVSVNISNRE